MSRLLLTTTATFWRTPRRSLSTSLAAPATKAPRMSQVEVDEPHVQKQLGQIQMDFVKKAEKLNADRASKHRHFRRGDYMIAGHDRKRLSRTCGEAHIHSCCCCFVVVVLLAMKFVTLQTVIVLHTSQNHTLVTLFAVHHCLAAGLGTESVLVYIWISWISFFIGTCIAIAISIYAYTIYAIKQERFLDDFEMPDPLAESERK